MAEAVGSLYSTLIPSLSDSADIQEALRLYHYGAASGTAPGEYDPTNTNTVLLPVESVAYYLNNLQGQITTLSGTLGVQTSAWTSKGVILTASAAATLFALSVGSDGTVLTADSSATGGISWTSLPVTLTNTVTLSNKTLTSPRFADGGFIADANGNEMLIFDTVASAVNELTIANAATGTNPFIAASGSGTNISINLIPKGTGQVQSNGIDMLTQTNTVTGITNKSLVSPTVSGLYLSDSSIVFEGSSADVNETTLTVTNPTAARTITLPDVSGTVITTGNLSSITTVGTVTAGSFPAANLTGATLASGITASSLTSVGTLTSVSVTGSITGGSASITGNAVYHTPPESKSANYLLALTDDGKVLEVSAAATIQVPTDASVNFPVGTQIIVIQTASAGTIVNFAAVTSGTTTVVGTPGTKLRTQWSSAMLFKRAANYWVVLGDLVA
jgi:hypothetical protein